MSHSANKPESQGSFVADIEQIRRRPRQHIEDGAVTSAYRGNRQTVIRVLNEALEQEHADKIAERITQLDGAPDLNPDTLTRRSHSEYVEGESLVDMIREDLVAERIAIESYNEIIRYLGDNDPTSRRVMEEILAKEEEHADDLKSLIETISHLEKQTREETQTTEQRQQPLKRAS